MINKNNNCSLDASFRDSSGFIFLREGVLYRQINTSYKENYDYLMNSGLYERLVSGGLLIPHATAEIQAEEKETAYKIIKPELISFISYPYEWCFSELKAAALLTLEIQKTALTFGMTLKDSSVYNVQFKHGNPIFIDTLSFERYRQGECWVAYRQFCQHFLAPLLLMSYRDVRLNQLLKTYIDGIPLDLTNQLLSPKAMFNLSVLSHIYYHAKISRHSTHTRMEGKDKKLSRLGFSALIDNLESLISGLRLKSYKSVWQGYYDDNSYSLEAIQCKKKVVAQFLDEAGPNLVFDLGANTGVFSRIASERKIQTISFDSDHAAVEKNYLDSVKNKETHILPLLLDLTNPTPGIGWENRERLSLIERGPADMAFVLALIHHLALTNNLPFQKIAGFLSLICDRLIIEFIPRTDPQFLRMAATREDDFRDYTVDNFEAAFKEFFSVQNAVNIKDSQRTLYALKRKPS